MSESAVRHLLAARRPDGGWGAYPGGASRTESTALAALALRAAASSEAGPGPEVDAALRAATAWLLARQGEGGGWPVADDIPGESWPTALAALALLGDPGSGDARRRAGLWLLAQEGKGGRWWVRLLHRLAPDRRPVPLDPDLTGWPWVEGTFSWVEPTAYALLALKRLRAELPAERTGERIDEAERMLFDRACPEGGWNYGNAVVFGDPLWPYPDTTALALLALADRSEAPPVARAREVLAELAAANDSLLATGLALLAFRAHGVAAPGLRSRLEARLRTRPAGEIRGVAWAALALSEAPDPLGAAGA